MRQRTALILAAGITTFILVIAAALIGRLAVALPGTGLAEEGPAPTLEPAVAGPDEQREAEYQRALQTASARLEEANRQLEEAYRRLTAQPASTDTTATANAAPPAAFAITPEQAASLAGTAVPGATPLRAPELVDYSGRPAYAVPFQGGSVYIDAQSGGIIHNELAQPAPAAPPTSGTTTAAAPSADAPPTNAPPASRITPEQAVAAAQAYVGSGVLERVRLEEEDGQLVYEVRFVDDSRVYVDPMSGRVIYARLEEGDRKDDDKRGKDD